MSLLLRPLYMADQAEDAPHCNATYGNAQNKGVTMPKEGPRNHTPAVAGVWYYISYTCTQRAAKAALFVLIVATTKTHEMNKGPNGNTPNGNTPNGNTPNGNTPNGNTPNGNTPNGNTMNGNAPNEN
ncbi:hypothetical protein BS47DRAFT_1368550 [Hydnum rufescens UP504]|uniref:Uncharacterized protein n=1 Tax=Hydnum rufescens UP504 TaxID=1448309 RepID=A0A9P6AFC4_9AGAM|nr:hypothetical protein BS47DRAFT_1368550 [Hydnum rufescens UP504]